MRTSPLVHHLLDSLSPCSFYPPLSFDTTLLPRILRPPAFEWHQNCHTADFNSPLNARIIVIILLFRFFMVLYRGYYRVQHITVLSTFRFQSIKGPLSFRGHDKRYFPHIDAALTLTFQPIYIYRLSTLSVLCRGNEKSTIFNHHFIYIVMVFFKQQVFLVSSYNIIGKSSQPGFTS